MCAAVYMQHAVNEQCSCTIYELISHQLMHSDYKQFCCGLCGRYFKRKETCKTLFWDVLIKWDFTMCNIRRRHFTPWFFNRLRHYISSVLTYLLFDIVSTQLTPTVCRLVSFLFRQVSSKNCIVQSVQVDGQRMVAFAVEPCLTKPSKKTIKYIKLVLRVRVGWCKGHPLWKKSLITIFGKLFTGRTVHFSTFAFLLPLTNQCQSLKLQNYIRVKTMLK